ncbi:MAG: acyl-CoA dehydrogenase family protein, partial [Amphiplicatus sp.]
MDFEFTTEQKLLASTADRFLGDAYAWERRRRHLDGGAEARAAMMRRFRDMGWSALFVGERNGGLGGGVVEAVILMEAVGRHLAVEPLLESFVVSARLIAHSDDQPLRTRLLRDLIASETFIPAWHEDAGYFLASG